MTKRGTGVLVLSGAASTFDGQINVLSGTLVAGSDLAMGSSAGATFVAPAAVLDLQSTGGVSIAEPVLLGGLLRNSIGDNQITSNLTLMRDSTVDMAGGTLKLAPVISRSNLTKVGGEPLTVERLHIPTLNVSEATVALSQKTTIGLPGDTTRLNALTITGGATPTAKLDITNNALVIDYGPADVEPFDTIRAQIISGFNGGAWDGNGIVTSLATAGETGVGYAEASALGGTIPPVFGTVDATSVLVRYTRLGDANLDGTVTLQDFNRLALNFGSTNAVWSQGDFNYDGLVTLQDFNRLALNFGLSAGPGGPTPEDWAALAAAVPEPAGLWLLGWSGILLKRRRIG
jgi:autotransporter-associated beta strand protein